jgi:hypothetical protein
MWTVSWQDFRRHAFGDRKPIVQRDTFDTQEAADRRKAELQSCGIVACVTPLALKKKHERAEVPAFNAAWKLAE